MSSLKTVSVLHPSSGTTNLALDSSGNVTVGNNLTVAGTATINGATVISVSPGTSGNVLTSTGSAWVSSAPAALPAGTVLQVVSTVKTDTFSVASTSFTDVTGLSVSITPSSTSSKILVLVSMGVSDSSSDCVMAQIVRNSTPICIGDASSSRIQTTMASGFYSNNMSSINSNYLDSPSTTSSVTYKMQMRIQSGTAYLNRSGTDSNTATYPRTASTITVMEIKG